MALKTCVIVTSIVDTGQVDFVHKGRNEPRSAYSPKERLEQLIETIDSIQRHMPGVHTIVIECSPPEALELGPLDFTKVINLWSNEDLRTLVRTNKNKGACECAMLHAGLQQVPEYDQYFKLTGRYLLTDNCDAYGLVTTKKYLYTNQWWCFGLNGMNTFFYKVLSKDLWLVALQNAFYECTQGHYVEHIFRRHLPFEHWPSKLGLVQRLGSKKGHKALF